VPVARPQPPGGPSTRTLRSAAASQVCLPVFQRSVAAHRPQLKAMRADLAGWLILHGTDRVLTDRIVLACSEAVANAVEHGCGYNPDCDITMVASIEAGTLRLRVENPGPWDDSESQAYRGHGVELMRRLMDDVQITTGSATTTVVLRHRVFAAPGG